MTARNEKIVERMFWSKVEAAKGLARSDEKSHFYEEGNSSRYKEK
jgi:hypothetical protein